MLLGARTSLQNLRLRGEFNRTKETSAPKKINTTFITKAFKSEKFKSAVHSFINDRFVKESAKEASKKLYRLVLTWQNIVTKKDLSKFEGVCRSIEEDRKTKLPWTLTEVSAAIDSFAQQFMN